MGDRACYLTAELLAGNNSNCLTLILIGMEVTAQAHVVLLDDDLDCLLQGLGVNVAFWRVPGKIALSCIL